MIENPDAVTIEIGGETFRSGTSKGRRLVAEVVDGPEGSERAVELAHAAADKLRTGKWIRHKYDEEGDVLTLADLLERNEIDIDDIERELKLREFDVEQLSAGSVVEVERIHNGEPQDPKRGVAFEVNPPDEYFGARAQIYWDGWTYSYLEGVTPPEAKRKYPFDELRLGRGNMMGELYDIRVIDVDEVTDEDLLSVRERAIESAQTDDKAEALTVTEESTWTTEAEGNNTDHHAKVTVSEGMLDEPVTVKCRNIFDGGWVANIVDADLDEEIENAVIRAARNESPIPTGVRL